ncbi:MAG: DUF4401 domain-containing protein [Paludibacteraceae bacterium]
MGNDDTIKTAMGYFKEIESHPLNMDEEAIFSECRKEEQNISLSIKIVTVFGSLLASVIFSLLLYWLSDDSNPARILCGIFFLCCTIFFSRMSDKLFLNVIVISSYLTGFFIMSLALSESIQSDAVVCIVLIFFAFVILCVIQNPIVAFLSILIIAFNLEKLTICAHSIELFSLFMISLSLLLMLVYRNEAKILSWRHHISRVYLPIRSGLTFSFISLFFVPIWFSKDLECLLPMSPSVFGYATNLFFILLIGYQLYHTFPILGITRKWHKVSICAFICLALLHTTAALSASVLVILLSFHVNNKIGLVLGILAFLYFLCLYYYDMRFSLLTKSLLLFSTGVLFSAIYIFLYRIHAKTNGDEKI